jgi:LmbE family N-acetylglucosaminyl deacetylase
MGITREQATGIARWLGLLGRRTRLDGEVVVISPHLDDAVFSLGAAVSSSGRRDGGRVTILTVLAGDPDSPTDAGDWDRKAGFRTAGEAARARREEDARACELVRARPVWLPFSDLQYERGGNDAEIRAAVVDAVGAASVLLPGFPLQNPDHRWLRRILDGAFARDRVGVYVEQPYAALWTDRPGEGSTPEPERVPPAAAWRRLRAGVLDQRRKLAACHAYSSQLPLLGPILGTIIRYEMRVGGEGAAWTDGGG